MTDHRGIARSLRPWLLVSFALYLGCGRSSQPERPAAPVAVKAPLVELVGSPKFHFTTAAGDAAFRNSLAGEPRPNVAQPDSLTESSNIAESSNAAEPGPDNGLVQPGPQSEVAADAVAQPSPVLPVDLDWRHVEPGGVTQEVALPDQSGPLLAAPDGSTPPPDSPAMPERYADVVKSISPSTDDELALPEPPLPATPAPAPPSVTLPSATLPPADDITPIVEANEHPATRTPASPLSPTNPLLAAPSTPGAPTSPAPATPLDARLTLARQAEMQAVGRLADTHIARGFDLAGRNALFSARKEFVAAITLVAKGLDAVERADRHAAAAAAGLTALEESDDFQSADLAGGDVAIIAQPHLTPVLKRELAPISTIEALQRYYSFAQERLVAAAGRHPAASMALHGLGKVYTTLGQSKTAHVANADPKGIVFQQAALLVDSRNFMAANELGVLLARYGKYEQARVALLQSVSVSPQPIAWRNLAAVHRYLGQPDLERLALGEAQLATRRGLAHRLLTPSGAPVGAVDVRWVDKDTLAMTREATPGNIAAPASIATNPAAPAPGPARNSRR